MAGLRLTEAVQHGVESFLVEQGPLRQAGSPQEPQGAHCKVSSPSRPGTTTVRPKLGQGAHNVRGVGVRPRSAPLPCCCRQPWPVAKECVPSTPLPPPVLRFLPPQGRGGGMEARAEE